MKLHKLGSLLVLTTCLGFSGNSSAQDEAAVVQDQPTQSQPANGSGPSSPVTPAPMTQIQGTVFPVLVTDPVSNPVEPDDRPLSGAQTIGLGTWGRRHSYIVPTFIAGESLDNNPLLVNTANKSYRGFTTVGSTLLWRQFFGRDMEFRYSGAIRYDTRARLQGYDQFTHGHGFAISKVFRSRTWNLILDDEVSYSQGSDFGNVGMEGMGTISALSQQLGGMANLQPSNTSLRPDLVPNQSILTGRFARVSNTALVEFDRRLNARDTVTLAASYGLLHLNSSLLNDVSQATAVAGYNHKITTRDSIAIESAYTRFDFAHTTSFVSTEYISAVYGKRITGRLGVEFGGGPEIIQSHASASTENDVKWQGRATVQYGIGRVKARASATHGVTGGAGVFQGAVTSIGQGTVDLELSKHNSFAFSAGVSRNEQLNGNQKYDSQFASVVFKQMLARFTDIYLSYDLQHQATSSACTGPLCNFTGVRNVFGVGFSWSHSPIGVQ